MFCEFKKECEKSQKTDNEKIMKYKLLFEIIFVRWEISRLFEIVKKKENSDICGLAKLPTDVLNIVHSFVFDM